jgi:hypothetical protein
MKDIPGYEGLYSATTDGQIWSHKSKKFLKPYTVGTYKKYLGVKLVKNGKAKSYRVHRLVAMTYLPNPDNLPQINHKDENPQNNCLENLEWCDAMYNNHYGTRTERQIETMKNRKLKKS